jgi:hypothetical protein
MKHLMGLIEILNVGESLFDLVEFKVTKDRGYRGGLG